MEFGRSVREANLIGCHFENNSEIGVRIGRLAQGCRLSGCQIANNAIGVELGYNQTDSSRTWNNVVIDTCKISIPDGGTGVCVHGNSEASHLIVQNCHFSADVDNSGVGIDMTSSSGPHGFQLINNRFPSSDDNALSQVVLPLDRVSFFLGNCAPDINTPTPETDWRNQLSLHSVAFSIGQFKSTGGSTPDVSRGNCFKTGNSSAVRVTDFTGGIPGQSIVVIFGDENTTVGFDETELRGNGGVDWNPSFGDFMRCIFSGQKWYCEITEV